MHLLEAYCAGDSGPCITNVFATRRKNFSQWYRSFQRKLLSHWLKFLRHVAITLVIQGPGLQCTIHVAWLCCLCVGVPFLLSTDDNMHSEKNQKQCRNNMKCRDTTYIFPRFQMQEIDTNYDSLWFYVCISTMKKGDLLLPHEYDLPIETIS